jgi:hypothetical protein
VHVICRLLNALYEKWCWKLRKKKIGLWFNVLAKEYGVLNSSVALDFDRYSTCEGWVTKQCVSIA